MYFIATPTPQSDWPSLLARVFKYDVLLLNKYHVKAPCSLHLAVADSYRVLCTSTAPDFVLYALRDPHTNGWVGMAGVEPAHNFLVTFGLALRHRTAPEVAALAHSVRNLVDLSRPVQAVVYERNKPAQRFLKRMGFMANQERVLHPDTQQVGVLFTLNPS